MNEAKLQWCRMSNVQIDYDDEDEDEETPSSKLGEDLEMITIERNSEMRRVSLDRVSRTCQQRMRRGL